MCLSPENGECGHSFKSPTSTWAFISYVQIHGKQETRWDRGPGPFIFYGEEHRSYCRKRPGVEALMLSRHLDLFLDD